MHQANGAARSPRGAVHLDSPRRSVQLDAWVRLHYVYPYPHVDQVIPLMAEGKRAALPRHSIPARGAERAEGHAAAGASGEDPASASPVGARSCPDLAIRSTFIVGFPGETEEDFVFLLDWLGEAQLARVGCFKYEDVDGAAANALPGQVPEEVKEERYERLMRHQQAISESLLAGRVGKTIEMIVDEVDSEGAIARSHWDAPEIDGSMST